MQEIIKSLIITLNKISVNGEENMDMLLGCIQTLKNLLETIKKAQEKGATENEAENQQGENV
jgi:hypothetical protein